MLVLCRLQFELTCVQGFTLRSTMTTKMPMKAMQTCTQHDGLDSTSRGVGRPLSTGLAAKQT